MPIVVLARPRRSDHGGSAPNWTAWPRARQLFYQRPVTSVELVSGVQSALLARLRQRDVRDHIAREIELRRELNHRVKNILASVSSIFEMTRRGAASVEALAGEFPRPAGRVGQGPFAPSFAIRWGGDRHRRGRAMTFEPYCNGPRTAIHVRVPTGGPASGSGDHARALSARADHQRHQIRRAVAPSGPCRVIMVGPSDDVLTLLLAGTGAGRASNRPPARAMVPAIFARRLGGFWPASRHRVSS